VGRTDITTWRGGNTPVDEAGYAPGTILTGEDWAAMDRARKAAFAKLRREKMLDAPPGSYEPNDCADLFNEAPWSENGAYIVNNYAVYRNGEGVTDHEGNVPCSEGANAWTRCCNHSKYVFLCARFKSLPAGEMARVLIHEALHVAGQNEDHTYTVSATDAPTTSQISDAVRAVCQ
jgi:hypothetical protein